MPDIEKRKMPEVKKVVRDGMVAVIYSPQFGAGWSTWNTDHKDIFMFHPKLVELIEEKRSQEITEELLSELGAPDAYVSHTLEELLEDEPPSQD